MSECEQGGLDKSRDGRPLWQLERAVKEMNHEEGICNVWLLQQTAIIHSHDFYSGRLVPIEQLHKFAKYHDDKYRKLIDLVNRVLKRTSDTVNLRFDPVHVVLFKKRCDPVHRLFESVHLLFDPIHLLLFQKSLDLLFDPVHVFFNPIHVVLVQKILNPVAVDLQKILYIRPYPVNVVLKGSCACFNLVLQKPAKPVELARISWLPKQQQED